MYYTALCNGELCHWNWKFTVHVFCQVDSLAQKEVYKTSLPQELVCTLMLTDLDPILWGSHSQYLVSSPRTIVKFFAERVQQTPPVARSNQYPCPNLVVISPWQISELQVRFHTSWCNLNTMFHTQKKSSTSHGPVSKVNSAWSQGQNFLRNL